MIVRGIYVITFKCIKNKQSEPVHISNCTSGYCLPPEGMLAALYVSYLCKSATHILLLLDDLVVCQVAPDLQSQTFTKKIELDSAFLLGTFMLVWAALRDEAVLLYIKHLSELASWPIDF